MHGCGINFREIMLNKQHYRGLKSGSHQAAKIAKKTNFKNLAGPALLALGRVAALPYVLFVGLRDKFQQKPAVSVCLRSDDDVKFGRFPACPQRRLQGSQQPPKPVQRCD